MYSAEEGLDDPSSLYGLAAHRVMIHAIFFCRVLFDKVASPLTSLIPWATEINRSQNEAFIIPVDFWDIRTSPNHFATKLGTVVVPLCTVCDLSLAKKLKHATNAERLQQINIDFTTRRITLIESRTVMLKA